MDRFLRIRLILLAIPMVIVFLFIAYIYTLTGVAALFEDYAIVLGGLIVILFVSRFGGLRTRKAVRQDLGSSR